MRTLIASIDYELICRHSRRRLDLSNNKLRSLPAEIGDCVKLQELMLNNNYMRQLPYELGRLFNLVILGLKGNPLGPDVLQMYAEPNGTKKLLEFMLDNLHGKMPVSRRRRVCCAKRFNSNTCLSSQITNILYFDLNTKITNSIAKPSRIDSPTICIN